MSPFRFAGLWALLPLIAAAAAVIGGLLGILDGWASTDPSAVEPWVRTLLQSPVLLIVATALIGMATNSWTIATITGALTLVTAEFAAEAALWYWLDGYHFMVDVLVLRLPIALLAGGALGLGGCVWHHESGYTRSFGAALLAAPLAWLSWQELASDAWRRDLAHLAGWMAAALAIVIVGRCRGLGHLATALAGTLVVAVAIDIAYTGGALDFGSTLTMLRENWERVRIRLQGGNEGQSAG